MAPMRLLPMKIVVLTAALVLVPAATALAENDGRGYYGSTDDKAVTNAGFILIIGFALLVLILSRLMAMLDRRKAARKAQAGTEVGDAYLRGGW
jgi:hypothetical protein